MSFKVSGTGRALPERVVKNEEMSRFVETSDQWIRQRVGIEERRICTKETAHDLACGAAAAALEDAGVEPSELDMILCATVGGEYASPSLACMVQTMLGADCPAMDVGAACSGFIYTLDTAAGFFARKKAKKMLVIGAERLSRMINWEDRGTCVIFADGAGAMVLEEGENYLSSKLTAKGDDITIRIPHALRESPFYENEQWEPCIHMRGQETYKFAVGSMCRDLKDVIEEAGLSQAEIDHVVPHQANRRIIEAAIKRLDIPADRYCVNIDRYGNTSAASIPIAIDELNKKGSLKSGDLLALSAFGGGLSSAACVLRW